MFKWDPVCCVICLFLIFKFIHLKFFLWQLELLVYSLKSRNKMFICRMYLNFSLKRFWLVMCVLIQNLGLTPFPHSLFSDQTTIRTLAFLMLSDLLNSLPHLGKLQMLSACQCFCVEYFCLVERSSRSPCIKLIVRCSSMPEA